MGAEQVEVVRLSNGVRIAHKRVKSPVAHFGCLLQVGSRNEPAEKLGLAHFVEHAIFKGTKKRKLSQILNTMENVGAELNAYTTKEQTMVYCTSLRKDLKRSIDVIADLVLNPSFPEDEIEREKFVVLEEIAAYKDDTSERICDDFEEKILQGSSLAHPILGSDEHIRQFTKEDLHEYVKEHFVGENMVLSCVANVSTTQLVKWCELFFGSSDRGTAQTTAHAMKINEYKSFRETKPESLFQSHVILGSPGYALKDASSPGLFLLNNILGGPALNSLLNYHVREKEGLVYSIDSQCVAFEDGGLLSIYFACEKSVIPTVLKLIEQQCKALCTEEISPRRLQTAKKQILAQIAIIRDSNGSTMHRIAKNIAAWDRIISFDEIAAETQEISSQDILRISNEVIHPSKFSHLIYTP